MIVGAPAHGTIGNAYVFSDTAGTWTQVADLKASDGNAHSEAGSAVAVSSSSVVSGAPGHDGEGRAYLYPAPPPWHPVIGLQAPDTTAGDAFGASLASSGTTVLVGAPGHAGEGSAYVFTETTDAPYTQAAVRAPANNFVYQQPTELEGSDTTTGDNFGASVAISGTTAVVGAPGHSGGGRVYVFNETGGTWTQVAELEGLDTAASDSFGASVATSGSAIVVGAPDHAGGGSAYVFTEPASSWVQTAELQGSDTAAGDTFGASVAISGTTSLVGAPGHLGGGSAYVFSAPAGTWAQAAEIVGSDTISGDSFGSSVAISGTTAIAGAPAHAGAGRAYVFELTGGVWGQSMELAGGSGAAGDEFGASVAISGDTVAVGAPRHTSAGIAYAYTV
jgi:hypothetical protein